MMKDKISKLGSIIIKIYHLNFKIKKGNDDKKNFTQKTLSEIINTKKKDKNNKDNNQALIIFIVMLSLLGLITKNIILIELVIILILIKSIQKIFPKIKEEKRQEKVIKQLPYVLRQISTELKAGIGLFDAMKSVAESDYGELSDEFKITLEEIHYGTNYNQAFDNLIKRNNKKSMKKAVNQIKRTLNTGGNLADALDSIADENIYELKIKYKEYSDKLNSIMLLYMFMGVLIPVILFIMIIAATTVIGPIIKPELLIILYLIFFPLIITFLILFIKQLEPSLS